MSNRQKTNDSGNGGLNFVFESGSSGRENKKYVRSHAAKVGWSQRSRNKGTPKDDPKEEALSSSRKRRRVQAENGNDQTPSQHSSSSGSRAPILPVEDAEPINHAREPASLGSVHPPHAHALNGEPQFAAYPVSHASATGSGVPVYGSASWSLPNQYHYQQPPGQSWSQEMPYPSSSSSTLNHSNGSLPPMHHEPAMWHQTPGGQQHWAPATSTDSVPQFRAAVPVSSTYSQSANFNVGGPISRMPAHQVHLAQQDSSDQSSTSANNPNAVNANWRQFDPPNNKVVDSPESSPPGNRFPRLSPTGQSQAMIALPTPPPTRPTTPGFLELVLNEDYTMWKSVDSGTDSFKVFPVTWKPFYSRLLENYRSNMLVQLEEILTGWTIKDKLEFNQMPLRLAASEPALFYSLLAAASIMMPPGLISPRIPQLLQSRTVRSLNEAFSDPKRAYSDATILTVNLVALFASTTGSANLAATLHQPFLRKMVESRGGLNALSSSGTLDSLNLVRFIAWTDRVIRCQTGNKLMFEDFKEDPSLSNTDWEDIWARMERRVVDNQPVPLQELPDDECNL